MAGSKDELTFMCVARSTTYRQGCACLAISFQWQCSLSGFLLICSLYMPKEVAMCSYMCQSSQLDTPFSISTKTQT